MRQNAARAEVLGAHNIPFDITQANLSGLEITDGKAVGSIGYAPPKPTPPAPAPATPAQNPDGSVLTMESLKTMSHEEVNRRWDEVQAVLKANSKQGAK